MQVSTQMNQTCVTVLNSTFSKLQTQLMKRFENIKKVMPRRWVVFAQHFPSPFVGHACIDEINVYRALVHRIARESSQVCGNFIQNDSETEISVEDTFVQYRSKQLLIVSCETLDQSHRPNVCTFAWVVLMHCGTRSNRAKNNSIDFAKCIIQKKKIFIHRSPVHSYLSFYMNIAVIVEQRISSSITSTVERMWCRWNMLYAFDIIANDVWQIHWAQTLLLLPRSRKYFCRNLLSHIGSVVLKMIFKCVLFAFADFGRSVQCYQFHANQTTFGSSIQNHRGTHRLVDHGNGVFQRSFGTEFAAIRIRWRQL